MNGMRTIAQLEGVFVQNMPRVRQSERDGGVNPDWTPFMNSFDSWMQQACTPVEIAEGLYAARVGCVITVTGTVKSMAEVNTVGPAVTFSVGQVTFHSDGRITNFGEDIAVSVSYIARK
jgi:hypothetical protein